MDPQEDDLARDVKRRTLVVTILGAGIAFLDSSVANVALPAIQSELGLTTAMQQWVASSYLLTLSVLLLVGGRFADLYGRRRMFTVGLVLYAVFAGLVAVSPSGGFMVVMRGLQGAAGAILIPTTLALINAVFPAEERGRAIGTWAAWSGIATILGPVLGGFVIDDVSWRYAFLITPAVAVAALALSRGIPESLDASADRRIDWVGITLLVAALGGVIFALIQAPISGWDSPLVIAVGLIGLALMPAFLVWERRVTNPVMPFVLFSNHDLVAANVVTFFVYAGLYGSFFYVPLYVQSTLGHSATIAGATFVPTTLLLFVLSPYAGRLNDRYGPRWLMCFGPLGAAAGLLVMCFTGPGQLFTVMLPGMLLFGIGLGFTVTPVTATAIGAADERFGGIASGFNNAVSRVAGMVAIAMMGVIVVHLWQIGIETASVGAGEEVREALYAVEDQAFVVPEVEGASAGVGLEVERRATEAGGIAFRYGMALAAFLVAVGGIVSAIWVRGPQGDTSDGMRTVPCVGTSGDSCA